MLILFFLACGTSPPAPAERTLPLAARQADAPPNIVVLLVDDAGHGDFSLTGSTTFKTPAIDQLATEGVTFTNAYVTASVCSPSRAGLLTGRYQQRFGHEGNPPLVGGGPKAGLAVEEQLLSDHLRKAGYATGVFGKWHLGYEPYFLPNARGFDRFVGVLRGERTYFPQDKPGPQAWMHDQTPVKETFSYVTDVLADETVTFMADNRDRPFFAYVAFTAVHAPLEAAPADLEAVPSSVTGPRRKLAAMTHALDRAVGTITDAIDTMGLTNDTLVVFLNDNGAGKKNHGDNRPWRAGKGRLYDGGTHVPYVIRWPGRASAGLTNTDLVSSLDIVPTALWAAGIALPSERPLDGVNLARALQGEAVPNRPLFWRMGRSWAVRSGSLKLISDKGKPVALYDLAADPGESKDLASGRPEDVTTLQALYDAWAAEMSPPAFLSATELRNRNKSPKKR